MAAPSPAGSAGPQAAAPLAVPTSCCISHANRLPAPALLICVTIGAILLAGLAMAVTVFYLWRRSQDRVQGNQSGDETSTVKVVKEAGLFACRKPVVIIDPTEDISYGRKESSYFPSFFKLGPKEPSKDNQDSQLPEPPEGGYYSRGEPGFFEVHLDMNDVEGRTRVDEQHFSFSPFHKEPTLLK